MKVLADTSALLALFVRRDQNHGAAARFARENPGTRYVVTELIISELATRLRALGGAEQAVAVTRRLLASARYELVFLDAPLLAEALALMARFKDKRLSLPDCASFAVIDRLRLDGAFTFDRDFRDCGYVQVPD